MNTDQVIVRYQEAVLAWDVGSTTTFTALLVSHLYVTVIVFSHENFQVWFVSLVSKTKPLFAIDHHLVALHEVLHSIIQLWDRLLLIWELVEIYQLITDYLELIRVWSKLNETLVL